MSHDTLRVDKFLCYKATTKRTIKNSEGTYELIVIAWYTPEIPLPYGPDGYGGLPGLILLLEDNGTLTTLNRINSSKDEEIKISSPVKGKKISEDDFDELVSNRFENRKEHKN